MLNEKFTFCFKITIKWNLTKSHATRLKSAKYKTHVIKEQQHALFTNFSAVAAMLPIMAKLSVILKSKCLNT